MKYALAIGFLLATTTAFAQDKLMEAGMEMADRATMSVIQLRDSSCGGGIEQQAVKNLRFNGCVMFVLGTVEMLREWQKANPAQAPRACVPRNVRAGDQIIAVQQYIDENKAWQNNQDATTAVIAAVKARWPC